MLHDLVTVGYSYINSLIHNSIKYVFLIYLVLNFNEADFKFTQLTSFNTYVFKVFFTQYRDKSTYTIIYASYVLGCK